MQDRPTAGELRAYTFFLTVVHEDLVMTKYLDREG